MPISKDFSFEDDKKINKKSFTKKNQFWIEEGNEIKESDCFKYFPACHWTYFDVKSIQK